MKYMVQENIVVQNKSNLLLKIFCEFLQITILNSN